MLTVFELSDTRQAGGIPEEGAAAQRRDASPAGADEGHATAFGRRAVILAASILGVGAIAVADYLTGTQLSFSIFYLGPILIGTRTGGRVEAAVLSLLSAVAWYSADAAGGHQYDHWAIPLWNTATRLGIFVTVSFMFVSLRARLRLEHRLSRIDPLTSLVNRRAFIEALQAEVARAQRSPRPFAVAYLDLDDFKLINDRHGHDAGDAVLMSVAAQLRARLRRSDVVARLGGDEFAVLMPETEPAAARDVMEEVHEALNRSVRSHGWQVGVSIGLATVCGPPAYDGGSLLVLADTLMYQAKRQGKNTLQQSNLGG